MEHIRIKVGSDGGFIIPVTYREALGISEGDHLFVQLVDDEMRIYTPEMAIERAQALVRRHVPKSASLVGELIQERRATAINS